MRRLPQSNEMQKRELHAMRNEKKCLRRKGNGNLTGSSGIGSEKNGPKVSKFLFQALGEGQNSHVNAPRLNSTGAAKVPRPGESMDQCSMLGWQKIKTDNKPKATLGGLWPN